MIYAIGDIHGQFLLLQELYAHILEHAKAHQGPHTIVFLGDYIDRGPQSPEVLDFLMTRANAPDIEHVFLLGNHEQMFVDAMMYPYLYNERQMWLENGGQAWLDQAQMTFSQFHANFPWAKYTNWIQSHLDLYWEGEHTVCVHGGLDIRLPMHEQTQEHIMWARHTQENWYQGYGKLVIHGHTPNPSPVVDQGRINVDTSTAFLKDGFRTLTCVVVEDKPDTTIDFLVTQGTEKVLVLAEKTPPPKP